MDFKPSPLLSRQQGIDFLIVEVKSGPCKINENTWGDKNKTHIQYALDWIGFWNIPDITESIINSMHEAGIYTEKDGSFTVRFCAIGCSENEELRNIYPQMIQIELRDIVAYVCGRFQNQSEHINHSNWDPFIREFADRSRRNESVEDLLKWISIEENISKKDLPPLDPERLNLVFSGACGCNLESIEDDFTKHYLNTLYNMQFYNFTFRQNDCDSLYGLFEIILGPMERTGEKTKLWLALGLAIKELYGLDNIKLGNYLHHVKRVYKIS